MKTKNNMRQKILDQPSYWVEGINGFIYNAILEYMEANNMNRTELAAYLGLSKGRVSQILNDGEINFSIQKLIQISLKVNKYPIFELRDKKEYMNGLSISKPTKKAAIPYKSKSDGFSVVCEENSNTTEH